MFTGHAARRIGRRGAAQVVALAALVGLDCAAPSVQPPATRASLERLASAVTADVFGRPASLEPLLADRAVLYFFRTDCRYCAAGLAAARALAARPDAPALVLISRESAARLRAVLGPGHLTRLVILSDSGGALTDSALVTPFVPRVIAVARYRVLLDETGRGRAGIEGAVEIAAAWGRDR
jgi:peroxiredoxin